MCKSMRSFISPLFIIFVIFGISLIEAEVSKPTERELALAMQRVADWQIAHFRDNYSSRNEPHHIRDWTNGALYVGMLKWAKISGDGRYQEWLKSLAERGQWELHWRTYMADDHVVGQLYLDLYRLYHDSSMLYKTKQRLDFIIENPSKEPIELGNYDHLERWTWCDALFMGPPLWAKMSAITGDSRYVDWMIKEYKATTDHLFDKKESLYYRDNNYIGKLKNNKKIFWARGNGWVFAGLTLVMNELDPRSKQYKYFKKLYLKMAAKMIKIQTKQGHWAMSLLDAKNYPTPETSGTSFITYGLAWGVNNGLLKKEKYQKAIYRAWASLQGHITADGMLGYVQPIGAEPGDAWPDKSEVYGSGAFLAAGAELYQLIKGNLPVTIARSKQLGNAIAISNALLDKEEESIKKSPLHARFVPERKDDFAWENDLVAFRAYGPALRDGAENAGIDCWLKRVSYPIIDKWYDLAINKNLTYHEDRGEGYDPYHVGASAGCGGTSLWINGKRKALETFVSWEKVKVDQKKLVFILNYKNEIDGDVYEEKKKISLVPSTRLFKVSSTFLKNGQVAAFLPIAVGLTTHNGAATLTFDKLKNWVSAWEKIDGSNLGTGVIVDTRYEITPKAIKAENNNDDAHGLLISKTDGKGRFVYFAGYGWEKAGDITNEKGWIAYLNNFVPY